MSGRAAFLALALLGLAACGADGPPEPVRPGPATVPVDGPERMGGVDISGTASIGVSGRL